VLERWEGHDELFGAALEEMGGQRPPDDGLPTSEIRIDE
jgi:hypothetical protein